MLLFSHTGITLGVATILANILPLQKQKNISTDSVYVSLRKPQFKKWHITIFDRLVHYADIRLILIGSMLPDIIDKPLGHLILSNLLSNGRVVCHSLLFFILLSLSGIFLSWRFNIKGLMILSFGVALHLVLDEMWLNPRTLFWPLLGFSFEKINIENWIPDMLHTLVTNYSWYIPELIGFFIIAWFSYVIVRKKWTWSIIKFGTIR
jgi:inner membrane protein